MKPRIAISAPMDVPMGYLCEVEDLLNENFKIPYSHISFWDRKSAYDQKSFDSANAVVFILPNFSFDSTKVKLGYEIPIGVRSELNLAIKHEKKICIAYKTASGEINIYNVSYTVGRIPKDYTIKGIAGTSNEFGKWVNGFELIGIDAQTKFEDAAVKLAINSAYGAFGELDHPSKFEQVKFPKVRQVYANLIPNPDYTDERLLLML